MTVNELRVNTRLETKTLSRDEDTLVLGLVKTAHKPDGGQMTGSC